ncbi:MAG: hypothetical protein ACRCUT_07995 [Spirochaetota bacterium]
MFLLSLTPVSAQDKEIRLNPFCSLAYDINLHLDSYGVFPLTYASFIKSFPSETGTAVICFAQQQASGVRLLVPEGIDPDPAVSIDRISFLRRNFPASREEIFHILSGKINIMQIPFLMTDLTSLDNAAGVTVTRSEDAGCDYYEITAVLSAESSVRCTGLFLPDTGVWFSWNIHIIRGKDEFLAGDAVLKEYTKGE